MRFQSHNISARDIRDDRERRIRAARDQQQAESSTANAQNGEVSVSVAAGDGEPDKPGSDDDDEGIKAASKHTAKQKQTIQKIKASKKFKARKKDMKDGGDEDMFALSLWEAGKVTLPGQQDNCSTCGKRFTVTPYSRADADGNLLCNPCGKELDADDGAPKKKRKTANGPVGRRRTLQSSLLDGSYQLGAKDLVTLCVEHLAKNIDLANDLGNLPDNIIDKIACILSKRRLLDSRTVNLFLQPSIEALRIYDAAKLSEHDFKRIFQAVPSLKKLRIRNGIHFTDDVMDYMLTRNVELEAFALHGANLLSGQKWVKFFRKHGASLDSLKISYTDKHVTDKEMAAIVKNCPSLQQLKICHNQEVGGEGVKALGKLEKLERLGLHLQKTVHPDAYVNVLGTIGRNLRTLSLSVVPTADNTVLDAIHTHCRSLRKLRLTESEEMTDDGFTRLFTGWENPSLEFIDFGKCRHLESDVHNNPDGVGLCSGGFKAMMAHSWATLRHLNIESCRHISAEAFEEVFAPGKTYPQLRYLEMSFCSEATDFVVGSIFRCCPKLTEVVVFGCMKIKEVRVPRGRALIGVPNAMGMQIEGDDDSDGA